MKVFILDMELTSIGIRRNKIMKYCYVEKRFQKSTMEIIETANQIIDEYLDQGFSLTLRQLYYQFVARGYLPNQQSEYKRLGSIISDGRLAGLIDWEAIEDRTRNLKGLTHWKDPGHIIGACVSNFRLDHWMNQLYHVEVWIEKEALIGVIERVCNKYDVSYFACKGYVSQSEMWLASKRMTKYMEYGITPVIIHLGDHDPSGIDMTRDIIDRNYTFYADKLIVERIALNMDQVEEHNPPPNPTKLTDTRAGSYITKYGNESWELDSLDPSTLSSLISKKILEFRNEEIYRKVLTEEIKHTEQLKYIEENWETL